jgi:hypothetical protein
MSTEAAQIKYFFVIEISRKGAKVCKGAKPRY